MAIAIHEAIVELLLVLIVVFAALIITRRNILGLFSSYALQSGFLAAIAAILYTQEHNPILLYAALLTLASKVIFIPWLLKKVQKKMSVARDVEFHYLQPTSTLFISVLIILLVHHIFEGPLRVFTLDHVAYLGSILGISLILIGMLVMFSRKQIITKVIGYLMMENGMVLFSIFIGEMPLLIEVLILMDLMILTLISALLAFGIDSTIEQFHVRLNPLRNLFKRDKQ